MTIRELLSYVAEASGCSVKIDGYDHLCFMYYEDSDITVTASEYVSLEVADYVCAAIDNVTILNSVGAAIATAGSGTNALYIEANPFLEEATATEAALILSLVEDFEYAPVTCEMFDESGIEVGTIATFGETASLVMHLESSEKGSVASSVGSDSRAEYNKSFETMLAAATKEALDAAEEASTKATKYITKIDNAGIKVHAYNDSTETPDSSNYAKINGDGLEVYKSGNSVAKFGSAVRVGQNGTSHVEIGSDNGMNVFDQDNKLRLNASSTGVSIFDYDSNNNRINVANFGTTARIGASGSARVEIGSDNGMNVFGQDSKIRANFSSTGVSIFDYDASDPNTRINVAQFGLTARIGASSAPNVTVSSTGVVVKKDANNHADVTSSGFEVYQGGNSVANFGSSVRIGMESAQHILMDSDSMTILNGSTELLDINGLITQNVTNGTIKFPTSGDSDERCFISGGWFDNGVAGAETIEFYTKEPNSKGAGITLSSSAGGISKIEATADTFRINSDVDMNGVIKSGNNKILTIDTVTIDNIIVSAGTAVTDQSVSATKIGYTPIGVIGFLIANATSSGSNSTICELFQCRLVNGSFTCSIRNISSSLNAKVRVIANILYIASTQGV